MAIQAICPDCDARHNFRDEARGKRVRCKNCSNKFIVGADNPNCVAASASQSEKPGRRRQKDKARKPAKGSTRKPLLIGGIVAGAALLFGGAGLGWYYSHKKATDDVGQTAQNDSDHDRDGTRAPKNIPEALTALKSAETGERRSAADWLAKQSLDAARQTEVAKALDPLLVEPNAETRLSALQALAVWATKDNVPALIAILKEESWDQQHELAFDVAALVKDPRPAPWIVHYLANPSARARATKTLQAIGSQAEAAVVPLLFHADAAVQQEARSLLKGWSTKDGVVLNQVLVEFKGADKARRRLAAAWLETAKPEDARRAEVAGALDPLLTDADDGLQGAALKAAVIWAGPVNVPTLLKLVEDKQDRHRKLAMQVLGKLKDPAGATAVAAWLPSAADRPDASRALKDMGPVATSAVTKYLDHADGDVRAEAKQILTSYNSKENLRLSQALTEIKSPDADVRRAGAKWFAQAEVFAPRRGEAAQTLEGLLKDTEAGVREPAIKALGAWGGKDNVPALIGLVTHKDKETRHLALEALGKLKDERAVGPVAARLLNDTDRQFASAALIAMGTMCQPVVANCLSNAHRGVRLEACRILEKVGTKDCVPSLEIAIQFYTSRNDAVLVAAAEAAAEAAGKR
jgi:HEAT repeat protein